MITSRPGVTIALISFLVLILGTVATLPFWDKTQWHLLKIQENGEQFYTIASCHKIGGCHLTGYRYRMDELADAEKNYEWFVRPDPATKIIEVVK
jgi:hypothetical protein